MLAHRYSKKWFNEEFALDMIDDFYRSIIRPKRGKKPPTMKIKLPTQRGELVCRCYDSDNQVTSFDFVKPTESILWLETRRLI